MRTLDVRNTTRFWPAPHRWFCWAALLALTVVPAIARSAETDLKACVASYEEGQQLLRGSELHRAREKLLVCARAPCPRELWGDCMRWLAEVDRKMPSVVLAARDADGHDVTDVQVLMDGRPLRDRLEPYAIEIDPGEHRFVFRAGDRKPIEEHIFVREGERSRVVTVQLDPMRSGAAESPIPAPGSVGENRPPVAAYVFGSIGLVALASFSYFGITGRAEYFDLRNSCSPHCATSDGDPARTRLLVADVSLGVSVVALGVALYLLLKGPSTRAHAN